MKFLVLAFFVISIITDCRAQNMPLKMLDALKRDHTTQLKSVVRKDRLNACYGLYTVLNQSIRMKAVKCFSLLLDIGVDVNFRCKGAYPIAHVVKYGNMDMLEQIIAKGADTDPKFDPGDGSLISYAEKYNPEMAKYLLSLKR